jgi:hypothetical protein
MHLSGDGQQLVIGTSSGAYLLGVSSVLTLPVYSVAGEPTETGTISAMASRLSGTLVAAENGIFHTYKSQLLVSPLSESLAGRQVQSMAVTTSGGNEIVWVAVGDALIAVNDTLFDEVVIAEESGAPSVIGAVGDVLVAAFETRLYEIHTGDWSYVVVDELPAPVRAMNAQAGVMAIATDAGLVTRRPGGVYTRFTLSDDTTGTAVISAAVDLTGRALGLTAVGLVRAAEGTLEGVALFDEANEATQMALDSYGNAWVGDGKTLVGWKIGNPVSFETAVKPILEGTCNTCHTDGVTAPYHDFGDYGTAQSLANDIVQRVSTGQMPPAPVPPLGDEDYQILISWYATGLNP